MTKYKVVLQYIGTRYAGWQIQKHHPSIQGTLKQALKTLSGEETSVVGAGRTDAGVHALGQVAHFRLTQDLPANYLLRALNGLLPWDIRVLRVRHAPDGFHAQKEALRKRYEYRIHNGRILPPFLHGYVYHVVPPLDWQAMQQACQWLCGSHDFSGFAASTTAVKNRNRTLFLSDLRKKGRLIVYRIEADGFLHHMVRNIVGTLMEIGKGRREPRDVLRILDSRDRRQAGPTAPAHGLYLVKVWYSGAP